MVNVFLLRLNIAPCQLVVFSPLEVSNISEIIPSQPAVLMLNVAEENGDEVLMVLFEQFPTECKSITFYVFYWELYMIDIARHYETLYPATHAICMHLLPF